MLEPEELRRMLITAFPDALVEVTDTTGTRDHFEARIISDAFEGKSMLAQHQLVYAALGEAMRGPIHALSLETYTPERWAEKKRA